VTRRTLISSCLGFGALSAIDWGRASGRTADPLIISTEYGKVKGLETHGVISFRGIPYGGSTEGPQRFMPPGKPTPWKGVREAIKAGPRAVQSPDDKGIFSSPLLGPYFSGGRADAPQITAQADSENCLVLNVLTPSPTGKRPVMVYIHGGGFSSGSGALTLLSDRFAGEQDVVLVGINHRLNAFGYTYLADLDPRYADSGNVGQLDLIAALQWVRRNIAQFGGDASNLTIFGESGGGAKISALLAMPGAKGLFHRAIIESGSARQARTTEAAAEQTKKLLSVLGLRPTQLDALQSLPPAKLFAAFQSASDGLGLSGGPVVDGRSLPHQTWTPDAPPEARGVSLIIGNCKDESTLFSLRGAALFSLNWDELLRREVAAGIPEPEAKTLIAQYRQDYPRETPSDLYFRISSDRGARRNAIAQAEEKLKQGSGEVYMYHFSWNTPLLDGKLRAFHTAELPLAMRLVLYPQAEELSRQIAGAWAGFARTGNPNHTGLPHWDAYSTGKRSTMVFDVGNTRLDYAPAKPELELLAPYPGGLL
jgi:para-nitrobenzyl esterase